MSAMVPNALVVRVMRPDEIALAADWAAAEGWNPGLADPACFTTVIACASVMRRPCA